MLPVDTTQAAARDIASHAAWNGVSAAFASLGRVFICLDHEFRILHASALRDEIIDADAARALAGQPIEALLGAELFGRAGELRAALAAGERREGWRALLTAGSGGPRLVSVTAAPFVHSTDVCDPRVAYVVVLRPAEDDHVGSGSPIAFMGLIARSEAMARIFSLVRDLEQSEATVLITGESGTGKEMVARAIHAHSSRHARPFVAVSCAALPGDLLESELFGHVRGAFTGAVRDREGRFELANGGTLFLDEIGDLPLHLQVKLLRVLQERSFERVGDSHTRQSDARIIAATNADLHRAVQEGRFRDDLYYRLRVVPVEIAPLRERREDIEPLARHLLARVGARRGRALRFSPDAIRVLLQYSWPGNVRELENALEYAVAVCKGQTIHPEDLPGELLKHTGRPPVESAPPPSDAPPATPAESGERRRLTDALQAHRWRRDETAHALGISRTTLWRLMREHHLED